MAKAKIDIFEKLARQRAAQQRKDAAVQAVLKNQTSQPGNGAIGMQAVSEMVAEKIRRNQDANRSSRTSVVTGSDSRNETEPVSTPEAVKNRRVTHAADAAAERTAVRSANSTAQQRRGTTASERRANAGLSEAGSGGSSIDRYGAYIGARTAVGAATAVQNIGNKYLYDSEMHGATATEKETRDQAKAVVNASGKYSTAGYNTITDEGGNTVTLSPRDSRSQEKRREIAAQKETAIDEQAAKIRNAIRENTPEVSSYLNFGTVYARKTAEKYAEEYEKYKVSGAVAEGIGGMLPSIVSNAVVPGSGLYTIYLSAAGGATKEAREAGADAGAAYLYGNAVGAVEVLTEKMFDGVAGVFGKGLADDAVQKLVKTYVKDEATQGAVLFLVNGVGEGLEEFVSEYADSVANKLMVKTDTRNLKELSNDALSSLLIGSLTSAVMQTGGFVAKNGSRTISPDALAEQTVQNVQTALPTAEQTSASSVTKTGAETEPSVTKTDAAKNDNYTLMDAARDRIYGRTAEDSQGSTVSPENGGTSKAEVRGKHEAPASSQEALQSSVSASGNGGMISQAYQPNAARGKHEAQATAQSGMGAADAGFTGEKTDFQRWSENTPTSGLHRVGENPYRAGVDLPKADAHNPNLVTSKTAQTVMEAKATPDSMIPKVQQNAADGSYSWMSVSDASAKSGAEKHIKTVGFSAAMADWTAKVRSGKVNKDTVALGAELLNAAGNANDSKAFLSILQDYTANIRSGAQAVQAARIYKQLSPSAQLYSVQTYVDGVNAKLKSAGKVAENNGVSIDPDLAQTFLEAQTEQERTSAMEAIARNVAGQIDSSWVDKLTAWRYFAMLFNPNTHWRNLKNNFYSVPVRTVKNIVATSVEMATLNGDSRSKAFLGLGQNDRSLISAAWRSYQQYNSEILYGQNGQSFESMVDQYKTVFKFKPLEWLRKGNNWLLDNEDVLTSKPAYTAALAGYLKARGITAAEFESGDMGEAQKRSAIDYAVEQAQIATLRDANALSNGIASLGSRGGNVLKLITSSALPFKRVPANAAMRAVEYSPLEVVPVLFHDIKSVRNGNMEASELIDHISSSLTGSALVAAGYFLAKSGMLTGGSGDNDDKEKDFKNAQGWQQYSFFDGTRYHSLLNCGLGGTALFVGAELYYNLSDKTDGNSVAVDWANAITSVSNPLIEQTFLSGVNDVLASLKFSDGDAIPIVAATLAGSYASQFYPTIMGAAERTTEGNRQTTYLYGGDALQGLSNAQYFAGKIGNKIPGYDYNQIPYIDAWGREESSGSVWDRIRDNFLRADYVSDKNVTAVDDELQRLYDAGEKDVLPQRVAQSTKITQLGGAYMTGDEYVSYAKEKGNESLRLISEFMNGDVYGSMSDEERASVISSIYEYATDEAKRKIVTGRGMDYKSDWDGKDNLDDLTSYFAAKTAYGTASVSSGEDSGSFDAALEWYNGQSASVREKVNTWVGGFEDLANCMNAGLSATDFFAAKEMHDQISDLDATANEKAQQFAYWLDRRTKMTSEQKSVVQDALPYSSGFAANTEKYDDLKSAGLDDDAANIVWNAQESLVPEAGHSAVTNVQTAESVTGRNDLSTEEKLTALSVLLPDSYDYYEAAYDCGIELDTWASVLRYMSDNGLSVGQGNLITAMEQTGIPEEQAVSMYDYYAGHRANPWKTDFYTAAANRG